LLYTLFDSITCILLDRLNSKDLFLLFFGAFLQTGIHVLDYRRKHGYDRDLLWEIWLGDR